MKVLLVQAENNPLNLSDIVGLNAAYERVSDLTTFCFRSTANKYGDERMGEMLVQLATDLQPDLIHLRKIERLPGAAVKALRERTNARIMLSFPDYRPQVPPYIARACPYADWVLFPHEDKGWKRSLESHGARKTGFWTHGVDAGVFRPLEVPKQYDFAMMANDVGRRIGGVGWGERIPFVKHMTEAGFNLDLFGARNVKLNANIRRHGYTDLDDFSREVSSARVCLAYNTGRVEMYTSWRRVFTTLAAGGFLLIHYFPGLEREFTNGVHLAWFETFDEAAEMALYYIERDDERRRIGQHGRQRIIERHTWGHRVQRILNMAFNDVAEPKVFA